VPPLRVARRAVGRPILFASALTFLAACSLGPEADIHLEGTVTDAVSTAPIEGAVVLITWVRGSYQVEARHTVSDSAGNYVLSAPNVICEALAVSVGLAGYRTVELEELPCTSEVQVLDFELQAR